MLYFHADFRDRANLIDHPLSKIGRNCETKNERVLILY